MGERDRGVAPDIWERHERKAFGSDLDRLGPVARAFVSAISDAIRKKPARFLSSVHAQMASGALPTAKQVEAINNYFEARGMPRLSCPIREANGMHAVIALRLGERRQAAMALAVLQAKRPLKPPGRV